MNGYVYLYLLKTYSYTIAYAVNLIDYAIRYLSVNRYRVAASNPTRPSFSQKQSCYNSSFIEIILKKQRTSLHALNFNEAIVNSGFGLVNDHLIEISSS